MSKPVFGPVTGRHTNGPWSWKATGASVVVVTGSTDVSVKPSSTFEKNCWSSDEPFVEYAGWLFAQRQILRVLLQIDPEAARPLIEARHPGVQRDVDAAYAFWTGYDGAAMDLGHAMNDAYLRLNQVEGGALSYSRAALLVVAWSREHGLPSP